MSLTPAGRVLRPSVGVAGLMWGAFGVACCVGCWWSVGSCGWALWRWVPSRGLTGSGRTSACGLRGRRRFERSFTVLCGGVVGVG
eukprot:11852277-Prorocentrum_lima.AAC.1